MGSGEHRPASEPHRDDSENPLVPENGSGTLSRPRQRPASNPLRHGRPGAERSCATVDRIGECDFWAASYRSGDLYRPVECKLSRQRDDLMAWIPSQPATSESLARLQSMAGVSLPSAYLSYLRRVGGGEGDLGVEPGWIQFWPVEEVLELNLAYEIRQNLPGFLGFGSNGGGELLAFDMREGGDPPVVMVPFIPMCADEAQLIATSFEELVRHLPGEVDSGGAG